MSKASNLAAQMIGFSVWRDLTSYLRSNALYFIFDSGIPNDGTPSGSTQLWYYGHTHKNYSYLLSILHIGTTLQTFPE